MQQKAYLVFTDNLPPNLSQGNTHTHIYIYIYIIYLMYDYDSNAILIEPLKTCQVKEIISVYEKCTVEKAILTFKNHFLSRLTTCNDDFSIHIWD